MQLFCCLAACDRVTIFFSCYPMKAGTETQRTSTQILINMHGRLLWFFVSHVQSHRLYLQNCAITTLGCRDYSQIAVCCTLWLKHFTLIADPDGLKLSKYIYPKQKAPNVMHDFTIKKLLVQKRDSELGLVTKARILVLKLCNFRPASINQGIVNCVYKPYPAAQCDTITLQYFVT